MVLLNLCIFLHTVSAQKISYTPPEYKLTTEWSLEVNPDSPLQEYPRPMLQRDHWKSLNGRWRFAVSEKDGDSPKEFSKEIIVPFPIESPLSAINQEYGPDSKYWYKRTFFIPETWSGKLVLLHFGASDWETTVYINGTEIGKHRGGYDPFSFDISSFLSEQGVQEIVVSVWDPTDSYHQPRGKQKIERGKIWYTPVSGIWQTVWIEPVDFTYVASVKTTPDLDNSSIHISTKVVNPAPQDSILANISFEEKVVSTFRFACNSVGIIRIDNPKLWSTENPNLYNIDLEILREGKKTGKVQSYFGMRKIEVAEDKNGTKQIFLNNKPVFQLGLLDQGWWPDGLYTAPTDEALKFDIEMAKEMGFNVIRKHVKVEPPRWYYHCDKLGMLVWQDMPNSDKKAEWKPPSGIDGIEMQREFISEAQYKIEFEAIINSLQNHPSIIKWIPFNEGWGQFKTSEVYDWVATLDSTRILGGPSGGNYFPVGHTRDHHKYPGPEIPLADPKRALILGEFGGLGYPVENHLWQKDKNWGYININSQKELESSYINMMEQLKPLLSQGLSGAIYTQITDVEGEVNGTMTYDRKVIKLKPKKVKKVHQEIFQLFEELTQQ